MTSGIRDRLLTLIDGRFFRGLYLIAVLLELIDFATSGSVTCQVTPVGGRLLTLLKTLFREARELFSLSICVYILGEMRLGPKSHAGPIDLGDYIWSERSVKATPI